MAALNEDQEMELKHLLADMLERHHVRCLISHSGHNSCEYCLAEGKGPHKGVDFTFPESWDCVLRTHEDWSEIAR